MLTGSPLFSIIIPVLHEQEGIDNILDHVQSLTREEEAEIIVVDGASEQDTINAITDPDVITLSAPKGRASQMNAGAAQAKGGILLFLHADTKLAENAFEKIKGTCSNEKYAGGAFRLGIDTRNIFLKLWAFIANIRTAITRVPYGDQAIFLKHDYFDRMGGYSDIPILEDLDLMKRVKKNKGKIHILKERTLTSARRWKHEGIIRRTFRNWIILILYHLGVSPHKLTRFLR